MAADGDHSEYLTKHYDEATRTFVETSSTTSTTSTNASEVNPTGAPTAAPASTGLTTLQNLVSEGNGYRYRDTSRVFMFRASLFGHPFPMKDNACYPRERCALPPTKDRDSAYYRRPDKYVDGENLVKVKISCGETAAGGLTGSRIRIFRAESASHQSKPQEIEVCEVGATGAAAVAGITVNGKRSVKTSAAGKTSWESAADNVVAHLRDVGKIDAGRSDHG